MKRRGVAVSLLFLIVALIVVAPAGNECGSGSPCTCGTPCQGQYDPSSNGDNTIDSCQDGSNPKYEWVEDLTVTDLNGSLFRAGNTVEVDAYFKCDSGEGDEVSINYKNGSSWRVIGNGSCNVDAYVHFKENITLDDVVGTHAVRAVMAWNGVSTGMGCGHDYDTTYSDTDDITFLVLSYADGESPNVTALLSPADLSNIMSRSVDFNFSVTDNTALANCSLWLNYSGQYSLNATLSNVVNNVSAVNTITADIADGSYHWNINCYDTAGNDAWFSANLTFTLDATSPNATYLSQTPQSGAYVNSSTVIINMSVSEPHIDDIVLEWNGTNETGLFSSPGNDIWTAVKGSVQGQYTFRVFVNDTFNNEAALSSRTVVYDNVPPSNFTLITPQNDSEGTSTPQLAPMLNWSAASDGYLKNYTVHVTIEPTFAAINYTYTTVSATNFKVTSSWKDNMDWYWRVVAYDYTGNARTSPVFVYHTNSESPCVFLDTPSEGDYLNDAVLNFRYIPDHNNLDECVISFNLTGTWIINASNSSPVSDEVNSFGPYSPSEGSYKWNVWCNSTDGEYGIGASNFTFIVDKTDPSVAFDSATPVDGANVPNWSITLHITASDLYPYQLIVAWNGTNQTPVTSPAQYYTYNTTVDSDGYYTFQAFLSDHAGNSDSTLQRHIYIDTTGPAISGESVQPTTLAVLDNVNITAGVADISNVSSVYVELTLPNSTKMNISLTVTNPDVWTVLFNRSEAGDYQAVVCGVDTHGWSACSSVLLNFTVVEATPAILNLSYSPSSESGLDPQVPIYVNATVTSSINVSSVHLQYREKNASTWTAVEMTANGSLYNASFTPTGENNWSFRIFANNTLGQFNTSAATTLSVFQDQTWTVTPADLGTFGGLIGTSNVPLGNITINNTGDTSLVFNVSQESGDITLVLNETDFIALDPAETALVTVHANAPVVESSYPAVIDVDALNGNADPSEQYIDVNLVTYTAGAYMFVSITTYSASVTQGDNVPTLKVRADNIGDTHCSNANVTWLLPPGWTSRDDLNATIGTITMGSTAYHNVTADVGAAATTGLQTLGVQFICDSGQMFNDSRSVTVSAADSGSDQPATTGGGGGGGSLITRNLTPVEYAITIVAPEQVVAQIGSTTTVLVNISNPSPGNVLDDIALSVDGYYLTHTTIHEPETTSLQFGESVTYAIDFFVPEYYTPQMHDLLIEVIASGHEFGSNASSSAAASRQMSLLVTSVTGKDLAALLAATRQKIGLLSQLGMDTSAQESLLSQAADYIEESRYNDAKDLVDGVLAFYESALEFSRKLEEAETSISDSRGEGLDVSVAEQLLQLAKDEFFSGKLSNAHETLAKASYAERIEAKTEEAKLVSRTLWFVRQHIFTLLLVLLAVSGGGVVLVQQFRTYDLRRELKVLEAKENELVEQMKNAQKEHYVHKLMGSRLYHTTMQQLRDRTASLQYKKIRLLSLRKSSMRKPSLETLHTELSHLAILMKELNHKFFVQHTLSRDAFKQLTQQCENQVSKIHEEIKVREEAIRNKQTTPLADKLFGKSDTRQSGEAKDTEIREMHTDHTEDKQEPEGVKHSLVHITLKQKLQPAHKELQVPHPTQSLLHKPALHTFWASNGMKARNLQDVLDVLEHMSDEQLKHHVNPEKNDFALWVRGSMQLPSLADKMLAEKTVKGLMEVIRKHAT